MKSRQWLAERAGASPVEGAATLPEGSTSERAFRAIARAAASLGLASVPVADESSRFVVRLSDAAGATLTLFAERRGAREYFRAGEHVGLWYSLAPSTESQPRWVAEILEPVAKFLLSASLAGLVDELEDAASVVAVTASRPATPYKRLHVLGAADVERFFHVDYEYDVDDVGQLAPTSRIGVIYQCNQPCTFCTLAEMNTHIPPARVHEALEASRARGSRRVILTGGEPTLCKHLVDYVEHARHIGFTTIELQTNATLLDSARMVERLREAGLTDAQVSLHGPDADISDRLTGAPGTHRRTLMGITNLLASGVRVLLNHLVFRDNLHLLSAFVDMVEDRWSIHRERLILQFHSPLNEFTRPELARQHIARYSEYAPQLCDAIDKARALGYAVKDLQDPTGIPALCVLGADSKYLGPILSQRVKPRFHRWESTWLRRVDACSTCDVADTCMGIPRGYVDLHGDEEFRAIRVVDGAPAPVPSEGR